MKLNKQSSAYFIAFFTFVIFGFVLVLNAANNFMKDKIELSKQKEITTLLTQHMPCNDFKESKINKSHFYYCKNQNIIAIHNFSPVAYAGKIEYLALFNLDTQFIKQINIITHKETPGLGDKIENDNWLATLYNKTINLLSLKQQGGAIDSFTAASITPKSFLKGLRNDIEWLKANQEKINQITKG